MKMKNFIAGFLMTFGITMAVNILITVCWNYFIKGNGFTIDWETGFRISLLLAIVIPLAQIKRK